MKLLRAIPLADLALLGLVAAFALSGTGTAAGTPAGSLDASFGGGGWMSSAGVPRYAYSLAVQPDGKILVAGGSASGNVFAVARLLSNGLYDPSFGSGGQVVVQQLSPGTADAVLLQSDGKVVVVGEFAPPGSTRACAAARLNPDGSLDRSFGTARPGFGTPGIGTYTTASGAYCDDAAFAPGGKIVLAGGIYGASNFLVARLDADGTLDSSFGGAGWSSAGLPRGAERVAVQSDGKIVVMGREGDGTLDVARITAGGVYDSTFGGGDGQLRITGLIADHSPPGLALQPDGKVVVVAQAGGSVDGDFGAVRLQPSGAVDSQFGINGEARVDFGGNDDLATAVAVQPDGKLVLVGHAGSTSSSLRFAVVRLDKAGRRDLAFGNNGLTVPPFSSSGDTEPYSVAIAPDGKIVVGGAWNGDLLLTRLLGDPPPVTTTTARPATTTSATRTTTTTTTVVTTTTVAMTTPKKPANPLVARIVYAAVSGHAASRRLVVRIRVSESGHAQLRLLKDGIESLRTIVAVRPGPNTATARIPATLGKGTCLLEVTLKDAKRNTRTYRTVVLVGA